MLRSTAFRRAAVATASGGVAAQAATTRSSRHMCLLSPSTAKRCFASRPMKPRIKQYKLTSSGSGVAMEAHTGSGHAIHSDLPRFTGGRDTAPEPVYLLLAALCGCEAATAAFVARHLKISLGHISFELT